MLVGVTVMGKDVTPSGRCVNGVDTSLYHEYLGPMAKKRTKKSKEKTEEVNDFTIPENKRAEIAKYRAEQERRLKELQYEHNNGHYPLRPWYEE